MELSIIIEDKKGVINITSEQFIIEDLKAHICSKMGLEQSEYKVAVRCGLNPSLELVRVPSLKMEEPKAKAPRAKAKNQLLNHWGNPLLDYTKQEKRIRKSILNHVWDNRRIDVDVIQFSKDMNNIYIGFKNTRADFKPLIIHEIDSPIFPYAHDDFSRDEVKEIAQLIVSNREGK